MTAAGRLGRAIALFASLGAGARLSGGAAIDFDPAPQWPDGLRARVRAEKAGQVAAPTVLVLGRSRLVVPAGATVGTQVDRVIRDIHWTPSDLDAKVPPTRAPASPAELVPYMEGRLVGYLMRFAAAKVMPLTPARVKLDPGGWGYAADGDGKYRFVIDGSKIGYSTAVKAGPMMVELPDTHGFASVAESAARRRPFLVVACMDMQSKAEAALYLARQGIHAYASTDRFAYELLGYRLLHPEAGTILGSGPIRQGKEGTAVIGDQPLEIRLDETIVAQATEKQKYPWQYNDGPWRYFSALDDLYELRLRLVKVAADAGEIEKVLGAARAREAHVVAVRVGKATSDQEAVHDAAALRAWLRENPRHRAVLLHSAAYEPGYQLFFDFPAQTTFGDLDPQLR